MNTNHLEIVKNFTNSLQENLSTEGKIKYKLVRVKPLTQTKPHHHHELEWWIIIEGNGIVEIDNKRFKVKEGNSIALLPLESHTITNSSKSDDLLFITLWWNDFKVLDKKVAESNYDQSNIKKILVLPSFPTPNGDLHLGHLAGPYIAADIYKRYQQMMGNHVAYLVGTIGYQTQVSYRSKELGLTFQETANLYSEKINQTLAKSMIFPEIFITTNQKSNYEKIIQDIFLVLLKKNYIKLYEKPTLYCQHCAIYLFEAHVKGNCPHCNYLNASSNECENCAIVYNDDQLVNPICRHCNNAAVLKPLVRAFFTLNSFCQKLLKQYAKMNLSSRLQHFIKIVFSSPLIDIPVTLISNTGVKAPIGELSNQRIFSMFELAGRYIAAVSMLANKTTSSDDWLSICQTFTTKLFFGYDNAFLRALIFPAVLMAYDSRIQLPDLMVSNEFYNLHDSKFSTSRNHAIWGIELIKKYSADSVRLYLSFTRPENNQTSFETTKFEEFLNIELMKNWEGWLSSLYKRLKIFSDGVVPEAGTWSDQARDYYKKIKSIIKTIHDAYQDTNFSPYLISLNLIKLVDISKHFSEITIDTLNAKILRDDARTHFALELMAARSLAIFSCPIMPEFSQKLWYALGYKIPIHIYDFRNLFDWLPSDTAINDLNLHLFSDLLVKKGD